MASMLDTSDITSLSVQIKILRRNIAYWKLEKERASGRFFNSSGGLRTLKAKKHRAAMAAAGEQVVEKTKKLLTLLERQNALG